jgi:CheY-like chemotaxis protein
MPRNPRKILVSVDDLFFVAKIGDAARRAGMSVEFVKTPAELIAKALAEPPALVIVDMNTHSHAPLELIAQLKAEPTLKHVSVIGFVQHVDGELKQQAHLAGADMVMARSAFSLNLPQILKRHAA